MIFVVIGNRSVDTTSFRIATIISANFIIVTDYRYGDTTNFSITPRVFTCVILFTSRRSIGNYATFFRITMSFMTSIRGYTMRRNILKYTTHVGAARIFSASIIIITHYIFIFTRIFRNTSWVTAIFSTFVVIITINITIDTTLEVDTFYRMASILIFTNVGFILATR